MKTTLAVALRRSNDQIPTTDPDVGRDGRAKALGQGPVEDHPWIRTVAVPVHRSLKIRAGVKETDD